MQHTTQKLIALASALTVAVITLVPVTSGARGIGPQGGNYQQVPSGSKAKIKGVITSRTPDGFILKDAKLAETYCVLTDGTRVLLDGKPVTQAQRTELAKLVGGIIVQVEGRGNASGQLLTEKISVANKDVRNASALANKVNPLEERTSQLEEQHQALTQDVAELNELTKIATEEAKRANDRVSALDNYEVKESASVTFAVNQSVLTAASKATLDALVAKSVGLKGAAYEITGYTDTTGNPEKNRILSEKRATAVITYLTDTHGIPLRRIVTPLGYGQQKPIADNSTPEGRAQNRRVEVKLMQQGGIGG